MLEDADSPPADALSEIPISLLSSGESLGRRDKSSR